MNSKTARHRQRIASRIRQDGWHRSNSNESHGRSLTQPAYRVLRMMATVSGKRSQIVFRLLDRTLASYSRHAEDGNAI